MTQDGWHQFLRRWNDDLFRSPLAAELPGEVKSSRWLGRPPAAEAQISQTEERLGIALPPSYLTFLKVSNGWGRLTHAIRQVDPVEAIDWFRKRNRDWVRAFTRPSRYGTPEDPPDEDYFAYGEHSEWFRRSHLKETLQITGVGDAAVYLLNPQVITKDGEWEAWFFANWVPGARRYRSFEKLMWAEYASFAGLDWNPPSGLLESLPDKYTGSPGNPKRRLLERKRRREPKLLNKPLRKWTVDELLEILRNPEFGIIHDEAIHGIGLLGDARAIEPLVELLRSGTNGVAAAFALKRLHPDRLREELVQILSKDWRSRIFHVLAFAAIAAELREERVVPVLSEILRDESPETSHATDYVGAHLAQLGAAGFDALAAALQSDSAVVRRRAAGSMMYTRDPRARDLLATLAQDPDPRIREIVKVTLEVLPPARAAPGR